MDKREVLKQYFGHASFRDGQEALIDAVLSGRDALGIMPTGGGKSLCYQIPALMSRGVALVISPLISLMKDQVTALRSAGVSSAFINSSLSPDELRTAYQNTREGEYKLVYISPERLENADFLSLARRLNISLFAVDEAHCISQWGQDFRPSYLKIADFLDRLPVRPVVAAFTATATRRVQEDIEQALKLRNPLRVVTGFDRPNLYFEVLKPKSKEKTLLALVGARQDKSGIVYCATRSAVEKVCSDLCDAGISATRYHAGLSDGERRQNQEDFIYDRRAVMVATNAFGMGIDKSSIGFVIHYNMPKSLEAYYQEAGRAGRDGERAECILLYSAGDIMTAKYLIAHSAENDNLTDEERTLVLRQDYERLDVMVGYCKSTDCLRGRILDYFGQTHGEHCGCCGCCSGKYIKKDITPEAQMILSCVKRAKDRLGFPVGAALIVRTLRGSADRRISEFGLDRLTTYGLMKKVTRTELNEYLDCLEASGYLRTDPVHGGIELTAAAGKVLFQGEKVEINVKEKHAAEKTGGGEIIPAGAEGLLAALKSLRLKLARYEGVPAYIVFTNACLSDMAKKAPKTMSEFLEVSGVGKVKAARYGERFIAEIAKYKGGGRTE